MPLGHVSILKPGQVESSYLSEFAPLLKMKVQVTTTWRRDPMSNQREVNSYSLDFTELEGITRLGANDPLVQIAEEVKGIREDWRWVSGGSRKLSVDVFTEADRLHERRVIERRFREQNREPNDPTVT